MLIKINDNELNDYGRGFKVKRMNYDEVMVIYPNEIGLKKFFF